MIYTIKSSCLLSVVALDVDSGAGGGSGGTGIGTGGKHWLQIAALNRNLKVSSSGSVTQGTHPSQTLSEEQNQRTEVALANALLAILLGSCWLVSHQVPFILLLPSTRTPFLVNNLQTLGAARFCSTITPFKTHLHMSQPIWDLD
jgi:hypothetical protein